MVGSATPTLARQQLSGPSPAPCEQREATFESLVVGALAAADELTAHRPPEEAAGSGVTPNNAHTAPAPAKPTPPL